MTGCPNGCGRPFLAEIAFVGRGPNPAITSTSVAAIMGCDLTSSTARTSRARRHSVKTLDPILEDYAKNRTKRVKRFGDFVIRAEYVNATEWGGDFHANIKEEALAEVAG